MRKINLFTANLLFVFHCFVGIFILSGWMFPEIKFLYLGFLIGWITSWIVLGYCPLTKWEFKIRKKYNENIDPNAEIIKYYAYKFFKIDIPSKTIYIGGIIMCTILIVLTLTFKGF